jgi:Ca2+-binding EF-hand superfamily protein
MNRRIVANSLVSSALFALLAAGCGGGNASTASAPITASSSDSHSVAGEVAANADGRRARFVERFDTNGNGSIELSELPARMQTHLSAADTNHDGTLSPDEMSAFRQSQRDARFARMDTNHDGSISSEEAGERAWTFIGRADADHNGVVTRDELTQAHQSGALRGAHQWHHGMMNRGSFDGASIIQRFDHDANGTLEISELPPRMQSHFASADADHDGKLSAAEINTAIQQHRAAREANAPSEE